MFDGLGTGHVDDRGRCCEDDVGAQDRSRADEHSFGDDRAGPDEAVVFDDDGSGVDRLQHASDAGAAGKVDPSADLGARADRGPGVDHGVRPHPGADVDVARHLDHARGEEAAVAGHTGWHHARTHLLEAVLERDLVAVLEWTDVDGLRATQSKVEQDRLLPPLVDGPALGPWLGAPHLAPVQEKDRLVDCLRVHLPCLESRLDAVTQPGDARQRTPSRISTARWHSSSVGTSASRK